MNAVSQAVRARCGVRHAAAGWAVTLLLCAGCGIRIQSYSIDNEPFVQGDTDVIVAEEGALEAPPGEFPRDAMEGREDEAAAETDGDTGDEADTGDDGEATDESGEGDAETGDEATDEAADEGDEAGTDEVIDDEVPASAGDAADPGDLAADGADEFEPPLEMGEF